MKENLITIRIMAVRNIARRTEKKKRKARANEIKGKNEIKIVEKM